DFLNENNQVILSWIAGAEFEGGGGGTTGDPPDTTGGETESGGMTTGAPEPTFANVQAILGASCSCHWAPADPTNGNLSFPMGDSYSALVGVKAPSVALNLIEPNDPEASYLFLKVAGGFDAVTGGAGTLMP